jgi:hypothetical protein
MSRETNIDDALIREHYSKCNAEFENKKARAAAIAAASNAIAAASNAIAAASAAIAKFKRKGGVQ